MSKAQLLEDFINKSGKTKTFLSKILNISRPTLYKLLENPTKCTVGQAEILCKELGIVKKTDRDAIFLP